MVVMALAVEQRCLTAACRWVRSALAVATAVVTPGPAVAASVLAQASGAGQR